MSLFYLFNIPSRAFEKNMYFHKVLLFWCGGTLLAFGVGKLIAIWQLLEFIMEKMTLGICMVLILGVDFIFC